MAWRTAESVVCIEEVVNLTNEPKIARLQKVDEDKVYKSIGRLLARMVVELHIADGLSTANIKNIAKRLTTDSEIRWWLTLADVDLLCRKIVAGDYGKFYGHFSEAEFNDCFVKYCNERNEVHRIQNDKVVNPDAAVLSEVGYSMDAHGNLVVPESKQGVLVQKPMRYLYDEKGNIKGENPKYWAAVRRGDEADAGKMEKINRSNRIMERMRELMMADPSLGYVEAINQATNEIENT